MDDENLSLEFRLKKINKTRIYFVGGIDQNQLMRKKHKKIFTILNYEIILNFFVF